MHKDNFTFLLHVAKMLAEMHTQKQFHNLVSANDQSSVGKYSTEDKNFQGIDTLLTGSLL